MLPSIKLRQRWICALVAFSLLLLLTQFMQLHSKINRLAAEFHESQEKVSGHVGVVPQSDKRIAAVMGDNLGSGYLKEVVYIFERLGFHVEHVLRPRTEVIWMFEYPFGSDYQQLKSNQRMNHFPGTGFVTSKVELATSPLQFIPKSFRFPSEAEKFQKYKAEHPASLWVVKDNKHRNIKIVPPEEIQMADGTFAQEFVNKPLLIDGHKFDVGIYVTVTSISPLSVYIFTDDWLIRFCPIKYEPFDEKEVGKYVVGDGYKPIWEVPSVKGYFNDDKLNFKQSFLSYLKSRPEYRSKINGLERDIEMAVREVYLAKQSSIAAATADHKYPANFFELVRFDFALDENLGVYLMEVNMSPNLSPNHFHKNEILYRKVIYQTLMLAGVGSPIGFEDLLSASEVVADSDLATAACTGNCKRCPFAVECVPRDLWRHLRKAIHTERSRHSFRRVLPPSLGRRDPADPSFLQQIRYENVTADDAYFAKWFQSICIKDVSMCSNYTI